jgi:hypothetical protein
LRIATAFQFTAPTRLSSIQNKRHHHQRRHTTSNGLSNDHQLLVQNRESRTKLFDFSEWRDQFFEMSPEIAKSIDTSGTSAQDAPLREICVLPFPLNDVLLQGETKELCLYEDRFHQLFEKSKNDHSSVVAMGLLAPPAGILQVMPLCEIENYRVMEGQTAFGTGFSILATIRVVGRAHLLYIEDEDDEVEYLRGWCQEIGDGDGNDSSNSGIDATIGGRDDDVSVTFCNDVADKLEDLMYSTQRIETRLSNMKPTRDYGGSSSKLDEESAPMSEAAMRRRLLEAEIDEEDDVEDDEEDDEDDDGEMKDRKGRLESAFKIAKACDYQGYKVQSFTAAEQVDQASITTTRNLQDLTALSWAYFSAEKNPDEILSYRLTALECTDLQERLKLALAMLSEQRSKLRTVLSEETRRQDDDDVMN